jgi:hypothetical protein
MYCGHNLESTRHTPVRVSARHSAHGTTVVRRSRAHMLSACSHALKTYGGAEVHLHGALPPGRKPAVPIGMESEWTTDPASTSWGKGISRLCREPNTDSSVVQCDLNSSEWSLYVKMPSSLFFHIKLIHFIVLSIMQLLCSLDFIILRRFGLYRPTSGISRFAKTVTCIYHSSFC